MTLSEENRKNIVEHRLQKAYETLVEAKGTIDMGFWRVAANRLYYACYYAVTALLIKNGHNVRTHNGIIAVLGKNFVLEGIVSKEQNSLYVKLFELRQKGDYDDWITIEADDVLPRLEPAQKFIQDIENLINT